MRIKISKSQWEEMGRQAGWMDALKMVADPLVKPLKKAFEPDNGGVNVIKNYDNSNETHELTGTLKEQQVMAVGSQGVDINKVNEQFLRSNTTDADLLKAFPNAVAFIKNHPDIADPKVIGGLKVLLYRIMNLDKDSASRKTFIEYLKKWYRNRAGL